MEWLTPDLGWTKIEDNTIFFVELNSASRPTIDAWVGLTRRLRGEWDSPQPILTIIDISKGTFFPSPYIRSKTTEMTQIRQDIKSFVAVILADTYASHLIETLVRLIQRGNEHFQIRMFFKVEEATAWLKTKQHSESPQG